MLKRKLQEINALLSSTIDAAIAIASDMITDATLAAAAKLESQKFSNCRSCQAAMENFLIAYPTASQRGKDEYFQEVVFPSCKPCTDAYEAHLDSLEPPPDVYLDKESEWEKRNLYTLREPLGNGLGPAEESVYSVEKPAPIKCECGAVHSYWSKSYHGSFIDGIANGCVACKPSSYERELAKASTRCGLALARQIATSRRGDKPIFRDVAFRYLQRFHGRTFAVQTDADACEIYLENRDGHVLGKLSYLDKYPKQPDVEFSTMPF